jgi:anaerobic selenocysteine-containing dehydrogenase
MVARPADARHDWEILSALTRRLSSGGMKERLRHAIAARLGARGMLDLGLRFGPFGAGINPFERGLSVSRLERSPHGEDLGPLQPVFPTRLRTHDRMVHLAPAPLVRDVARLAQRLELPRGEARGATLALIGRRQLRSNNSWMHNSERLMRGKDRCTLLIHPADAAARGIGAGARVRLRSRTGEVDATAELTDEMMPGVVSLPHGWGQARAGVRLGVATRHPGASLNDLTDDQRLDALSGNAAFSGVPVTVEAIVATDSASVATR